MVQTLMATVRRSALLRAGVVTAVLIAVIAMASGALPFSVQCLVEREACDATGAVITNIDAPAAETAVTPTFPPPATSERTDAATPSVKVARAAVTHDDLINASFAALVRGPRVTAPAEAELPAHPTTRVVQTTPVTPLAAPPALSTSEPETAVAEATPGSEPKVTQVAAVDDNYGPPRIGAVAVNARSGPAVTNKKLFSLAANVPVTVLANESKWLKVDDGKGHIGWVYGDYVAGDATPTATDETSSSVTAYAEDTKPKTVATVLGSGVSVRSGAGSSYEKLFALAGGEEVDITEEKRGWLHIVDSKGRSGWAYSSFFKRGG